MKVVKAVLAIVVIVAALWILWWRAKDLFGDAAFHPEVAAQAVETAPQG